MGFFSTVGGVISTAASTLSKAASVVGSTVSKLGTAISSVAKTLVAKIPKPEILTDIIVAVVKVIAEKLGLIEEEEQVEELGAKAMQSEKDLEDFNSAQEYIEHLRNEVELDIEKFNAMKVEERLVCSAIGVSILSKGIEEKEEVDIPADFWIEVGKQDMKAEEVEAYIKKFKEHGFSELKLSDYFKGSLSVTENKEIDSIFEETLKELNPELSDEDIADKMLEIEQTSRKDWE
ncbi:hypothetical protein MWH25_02370 [Natroniella acetigena]|uniref:hypothetical protein n=1 Tax=Natroniella acetigena TaxID=52004 RepID=UPI00200A99F0|nr:hypothetical protein [Natroniella acetigena]MCK8826594.1 hypothetical protein [Natroniella acetigena]